MPPPLEEAVVVITGASSGIGRAAAMRFAHRSSSLALCARSGPDLEQVGRECEAAGAGAVLIRDLDVADQTAVDEFALSAIERLGGIDVWVNNAAVIAYGSFLEIPPDSFRRVLETNLFGQVNGARAALRHFSERRAGVLINMSSVWGRVSSPYVAPYVVSKNAVRALSECLRGELAGDRDIHVTTMAPATVDTPIYANGANYSGRRIRPIPPVLEAERIAEGIEMCAESPKREVNYGRAGRILEVVYAIAPPLYRRFAHRAFTRGALAPDRAAHTDGNLEESTGPHGIDGEWRRRQRPTLRRALLAAVIGGAAGVAGPEGLYPHRGRPPGATRLNGS